MADCTFEVNETYPTTVRLQGDQLNKLNELKRRSGHTRAGLISHAVDGLLLYERKHGSLPLHPETSQTGE